MREIDYQKSSDSYFRTLRGLGARAWLDSGRPYSDAGRFDILSAAPSAVFIDPGKKILEDIRNAYCEEWQAAKIALPFELPFTGGLIGHFNYEYNLADYRVPPHAKNHRPSVFGIYDWAIIQDHIKQLSFLVFHPRCTNTTTIAALINRPLDSHENLKFKVQDLHADLPKKSYLSALKAIEHYIIEGDTYQINFSQRFSARFSGSTEAAYLALRSHMPSPFSAYLEIGDDTIMSFSPERFIEIEGNMARTQPIKGTAPRGKTEQEDRQLANALIGSEKNRAENLMIVDLLRNDFSQSCEPFSVSAPRLFELQSFANVHHLVSTVEGKISPNISHLDFFLRCFPGGSITGAPKKRAMEIIRELETEPRNAYCGSVCYLSASGNLDSNIAIRTLLVSEGKIYCWGGGGIVFDSEAEDEYQESVQKIAVLIEALHRGAEK